MYKLDDEQEYVEAEAYRKGFQAGIRHARMEFSGLPEALQEALERLDSLMSTKPQAD